MNKKTDVHFVQHTHWDREWYFTSDDSRTMLYYDLRFLIEYLEKHEDKFSLDGQSSVIDDFLKFSPEYKSRFQKLIRDKKIFVGPFYTQTDTVLPAGESIIRNIEVGKHLASEMGHCSMVGYLPDTFGHNNQMPQILKLNGITNMSFYRGLDPKDTNNELYFKYESPDKSSVLGHWQTHYSTKGEAFEYTLDAFENAIIADYTAPGQFHPSVKSYAKRNRGLPVGIPIGTDQMPFNKNVKNILQELNKKYDNFNFIVSDYETLLSEVALQVKKNNIALHKVTTELRQALTGRVHRTVLSSRVDIKQKLFNIESTMIDVVEPLSILCLINGIDVPWKMIDFVWKEIFKSSAHDSYGSTNEDHVNAKIEHRLISAQRVADDVVAMLTKLYTLNLVDEDDEYKKIVLFNLDSKRYSGQYEFTTTVKKGYDDYKFRLYDNGQEIKYLILDRNNIGTHERDALTLMLFDCDVEPYSTKVLDIIYFDEKIIEPTKNKTISYRNQKFNVSKDKIVLERPEGKFINFIKFAMDPSAGDTYDHSPLTFDDKKYILSNFRIVESYPKLNSMIIEAWALVPSGLDDWKTNKSSVTQKIKMIVSLLNENEVFVKAIVKNTSLNGRMVCLIDTQSKCDSWYHDQQFGIYERNLINKYMNEWTKPDKLGYKWDEYPTNLSPVQSFVSNKEQSLCVFLRGSREHEMIKFDNSNHFAITMYRAFDVFGKRGLLYRPGRGSGANTWGPDNQMLDKKMEFEFIVHFGKLTLEDQFEKSKQLKNKTYFIPGQWALDRTILRWKTDFKFYDKSSKNKKLVSVAMLNKYPSLIQSALYRTQNHEVILRMLNVGDDIELNLPNNRVSRDLVKFEKGKILVPKFGLVNIVLEA